MSGVTARQRVGLTGKEEDVEVGLQYFGKRFLNPLLGRRISADPLAVHAPGEADLNLYAYVRGLILKAIDAMDSSRQAEINGTISTDPAGGPYDPRLSTTGAPGMSDQDIAMGLELGVEGLGEGGGERSPKSQGRHVAMPEEAIFGGASVFATAPTPDSTGRPATFQFYSRTVDKVRVEHGGLYPLVGELSLVDSNVENSPGVAPDYESYPGGDELYGIGEQRRDRTDRRNEAFKAQLEAQRRALNESLQNLGYTVPDMPHTQPLPYQYKLNRQPVFDDIPGMPAPRMVAETYEFVYGFTTTVHDDGDYHEGAVAGQRCAGGTVRRATRWACFLLTLNLCLALANGCTPRSYDVVVAHDYIGPLIIVESGGTTRPFGTLGSPSDGVLWAVGSLAKLPNIRVKMKGVVATVQMSTPTNCGCFTRYLAVPNGGMAPAEILLAADRSEFSEGSELSELDARTEQQWRTRRQSAGFCTGEVVDYRTCGS